MKCIYCGNTKTKIVNSRSTNDSYSTWRRHQCIKCNKLFTTLELPNYDQIFIDKKKLSLSQLSLDIASCFTHNPNFAKDRALWISKIIILELFSYQFMNWYFTIYIVTNERIRRIVQHGFFGRDVFDIDLDKIQNISYSIPGFFGEVFHFGTIIIQTLFTSNL